MKIYYAPIIGSKPNYIEQMKYSELSYGLWAFKTKIAAENENTICIWTIKWKT